MDSVMNIMREVELQEKAAQQAREEAARGGLEILTRVEELKEMLQHAKEANGMVVYLSIRRCYLIYEFLIFSQNSTNAELCFLVLAACRRSVWRKGHFSN